MVGCDVHDEDDGGVVGCFGGCEVGPVLDGERSGTAVVAGAGVGVC